MLFILAIVSAIFVAIVHFVPGLQLVLILIAILLAFSVVSLIILRVAGIITDETFSKLVNSFFTVLPILKGKDPESPNIPEKQLPEDPEE